jgi:hypothetical protein
MTRPPVNPGYNGGAPGYDAGYYNQYNNYWSNMAAWQQYNQYYQGQPNPAGNYGPPPTNLTSQPPPIPVNYNTGARRSAQSEEDGDTNGEAEPSTATTGSNSALQILDDDVSILDGPLNQAVDHSKPFDYYKLNRRYFSSSADLYDALDESGWGTIEDSV